MAYRTDAYRASTGELFGTMAEAEHAEVMHAANLLGGISVEGWSDIVSGKLDSRVMRDAIRTIAKALPPEPAEPEKMRGQPATVG